MNKFEWNSLDGQQQDIWFLSLEQLEQIITHINIIIVNKAEELSQELESTEQERDEAMDSSAEDNIQESKTVLQGYTRDYIAFLMILSFKLQEYKNDMADTFQVKDINRKIYLDYFELDVWIRELEADLGINSEYINNIVNDNPKLKEWEIQREKEFSDWCDFNDGGFLKSDREEEKKYEEAKKIYQKASYEIKGILKFQDELDWIIKNVSKTKGIKDIEDAFVVEELIQIIEQVQKGNYDGIEKVKVVAMGKLKSNQDKNTISQDGLDFLRNMEDMNSISDNGDGTSQMYLIGDENVPDILVSDLEGLTCNGRPTYGDGSITLGYGLTYNTINEGLSDINKRYNTKYTCSYKDGVLKVDDIDNNIIDQLQIDRINEDYGKSIVDFNDNYNLNLSQQQIDALIPIAYKNPTPFYTEPYASQIAQMLETDPLTEEGFVQCFQNIPVYQTSDSGYASKYEEDFSACYKHYIG